MKGFLYHTAAAMRREIGRIVRMRMYRMLLFYLPLAAFAFFALFFSKGVPRNIPIAVVDDDRTALSRKLVEMLDAAPTAYVAYVAPSMNEAERLMREGEIMAVVLIPSDFEKELLRGVPTPVEAYITGTNITVNGLLSKDIQTVVTTFSAGVQLQLLTVQGMSDEQAMAQIMPVRFNRHVLFNPYINYGYYLAPSFMPMMLLIFAVMATVFAVGTELKHGTAREWLNASGDLMTAALTGKLLPVTAMLLLQAFVMLFILIRIVGVPLNGSYTVMLVGTCCFLLGYQAIAVLIVALMANMRLSLSLSGGYSVLAFTFSGLTFPIMAMWAPMRWLSLCFPFTYYTDLFIDQMMRGAPVVYSLSDLGYMALFMLLPLLVLPRLRKVCTEPKYWGRA
ncbi:MAG: ABC transporter permease [Alistipes sp.]|nr:ABC transporter permease [Alistipes sp.]